MLPFVTILGRSIPTYSLCIFAGILLATPALIFLPKRFGVKTEDGIYSFIYAFIGLVIGGKILFLIINIGNLTSIVSQFGILAILQGGFVIYGGLLGAFFATWIYCRQFQIPSPPIFSLLITVTPLIQSCGRIGCFFAGCCYGLPWDSNVFYDFQGVSRFPIQLLCAALDLILFIFLISRALISNRKNLQFPLYLILYSSGRFIVEFFRGDSLRGVIGWISVSQIISILFFVAGLSLIFKDFIDRSKGEF